MKKQDKFLIIGLLVFLGLGVALTFYAQSRPSTTIETEVVEFRHGEFNLMANRLFAADERGLPADTLYSEGRVSLTGTDIFIIQDQDEDPKVFVAVSDQGTSAYAEFPLKDEDLVDWSGARIIYVRDSWLVSAGTYVPGIPIRQQINAQVGLRGGTTNPIIFGDGRLYVPVYCYTQSNDKCVFVWLETKGAKVSSFALSDTAEFSYMILENVQMAGMTVKELFIPISINDAQFLQACFKSLNGDPKVQCSR